MRQIILADALIGDVSERHDMIRYPEFIAKDWQIGSGTREATCKLLTAEGFRNALGRPQREKPEGARHAIAKRTVEELLANPLPIAV
ncbi:MAG: hypothetical protein LC104_10365 [Bacteroidales bacterium]|nr:hypothetical protein [Bacteroidales bacterium]